MILCIDIGNTTASFGVFKKSAPPHVHHELVRTFSYLTKELTSVERELIEETYQKVMVSSVVPDADKLIQSIFPDAIFITDKNIPKIKIKTKNPSEVGADRIVCSYGAWKLFKDNALIVDFGTATTIDVILKNGEYQGGLILPGLSLSRDVLAERTAKLPHIDLSEPPVLIGQNTVESMQSGLVHGYRAMIDGLIEKIEDKLKLQPKKIFCGGYATLIAASLKHTPDLIDPYLILKSLCDLSDILD
jgi:type III pantothenate kinase